MRKTVMVVDDNPTLLEVFRIALESDGYVVAPALGAEKALELAKSTKPDLIISDIIMPGINGFQFWEKYKESFPFRRTPFIFLSGLGTPENIISGLNIGVDDYLVKPITDEMLTAKVNSILGRQEKLKGENYEGNLSDYSLPKVFEFCRQNSLSGRLVIQYADHLDEVFFQNGKPFDDRGTELVDDPLLSADPKEGYFWIITSPPNFEELKRARTNNDVSEPAKIPCQGSDCAGFLSAVRLGSKSVDIQTEITFQPTRSIITTAYFGGRVLLSEKQDFSEELDVPTIEEKAKQQHQAVEQEIRTRLRSRRKKAPEKVNGNEDSSQPQEDMFIMGHKAFDSGEYEKAVQCWEKALIEEPGSRFVTIHLDMAKERLKQKQGTEGKVSSTPAG